MPTHADGAAKRGTNQDRRKPALVLGRASCTDVADLRRDPLGYSTRPWLSTGREPRRDEDGRRAGRPRDAPSSQSRHADAEAALAASGCRAKTARGPAVDA